MKYWTLFFIACCSTIFASELPDLPWCWIKWWSISLPTKSCSASTLITTHIPLPTMSIHRPSAVSLDSTSSQPASWLLYGKHQTEAQIFNIEYQACWCYREESQNSSRVYHMNSPDSYRTQASALWESACIAQCHSLSTRWIWNYDELRT